MTGDLLARIVQGPLGEQTVSVLGVTVVLTTGVLVAMGVAASLLLFGKSVSAFLLTRKIFSFLAKQQEPVARSVSSRLLSRNLTTVRSYKTQDLAFGLTQGVNAVIFGMIGQPIVALSEIVLLSVLALSLTLTAPLATAFATAYFGFVAYFLYSSIGKRMRTYGQMTTEAEIASLAGVQLPLHAYREVRTVGTGMHFAASIGKARGCAAEVQAKTFVISQAAKYVFEVALIVGGAVVAALLLYSKPIEQAAAGITIFALAASRVLPSLQRLQLALFSSRNARGIAENLINLEREISIEYLPGPGAEALNSNRASRREGAAAQHGAMVRLEGLSYSYPDGHEVIKNLSLVVQPGEFLAVVGPSGAGKSTLVDLVAGLLEPTSGSVSINDRDAREFLASRPGAIGYVPQNVSLMPGTVRDNVLFGRQPSAASDGHIRDMLATLGLSDFLDRRQGLDTLVGESANELSGGQRQRLGLARALLGRPILLLMDEATSALDRESEERVSALLEERTRGITRVVVAHRLSTISACDRLMYVSDGRVTMAASLQELGASLPDFANQVSQMGIH